MSSADQEKVSNTGRMNASRRHGLLGTSAGVVSVAAGALSLILIAMMLSVVLRFADAAAAQSACLLSSPPGALVSEASNPIGELSAFPLGLRCTFPSADGGTVVAPPDLSLTFVAVGGVALAVICAVVWGFGRQQQRLAAHHRVLVKRAGNR